MTSITRKGNPSHVINEQRKVITPAKGNLVKIFFNIANSMEDDSRDGRQFPFGEV
jgi:hypothetical protein